MKHLYQDLSKIRLQIIISILGQSYFKNKKIVDFGCGDGEIALSLHRLCGNVTAIDARQVFLNNLNKNFKSLKTINFNLENNFEKTDAISNIDIAISFDVLSHLTNYESHLISLCNNSKLLLLESEVVDSKDENYFEPSFENKENNYYSYTGNSSSFSDLKVEKILKSQGMSFIRLDTRALNYRNFIYDWKPTGTQKKLRRFWVISKSKDLIKSIRNKCISSKIVYKIHFCENIEAPKPEIISNKDTKIDNFTEELKTVSLQDDNKNVFKEDFIEIIKENNVELEVQKKETIKKGLSIIIPARKSQLFINECYDSIVNQTYKDIDVEILIGIDACVHTLNHIRNNPSRYYKDNVKVFLFGQNVGPYIIKNTLSDHAKYENILFFDSDDIMGNKMIQRTVDSLNESSTVRYMFYNFKHKNGIKKNNLSPQNFHAAGIMGIKKEIFNKYNGFEGWICAADNEFNSRMNFFKEKETLLDDRLFYRRIHDHNLEFSKDTNFASETRKQNHIKIFKKHIDKNWAVSKKQINNNFIIFDFKNTNNLEVKGNVSVIIPAWKAGNFINECIDSILKQQTNNINIEILIGVDACENTLNYIRKHNIKYNQKNIKVFYFEKNIGPYIIRNTLVDYASYENILFFDSDDIMMNNMVEEILRELKNNDIVRYNFSNFTKTINSSVETNGFAGGSFAIKKNIFNSLNGFEPWICAADGEFIRRVKHKKIDTHHIQSSLFYRRIHENNQTSLKQTGMRSKLRNDYHKIIEEKMANNFKDELKEKAISKNIEEISLNNKTNKQKKYLHLVISRVAIKWKLNDGYRNESLGMSWEEWVKDSFKLYDNYCRKSLKSQTNQNFKLISLIDPEIQDVGSKLENEEMLYVSSMDQICECIKKYISLQEGYDHVLLTRIDRDDVVSNTFIDNLQSNVNNYFDKSKDLNAKFYFDINDVHVHSIIDNNTYHKSFYNTVTSPFISVLEKTKDLECIIYKYDHSAIKGKIKGNKYNNLEAIQIVHDHNLLNHKSISKLNLKKVKINLEKYSI